MVRAIIAGVLAFAATPGLTFQDPMSAAKDLYGAAAYEEALSALQRIVDGGGSESIRQAEQYRAFCLLALGRTSEAESAAEAAVRQDPLIALDARDASPRVEAMFASVRRRLLPSLIREHYRTARDRINQGERAQGLQDLEQVRRMLDAARTLKIPDETLTDLSVLVDGFLDLQRVSEVRPPAADASALKASDALAPASITAAPSAPVAATPPATAPPARIATIYTAADADVVAPVALRQDIPEIILDTSSRKRTAVVEVTIDARGGVRSAVMRESISTWIDDQLLKAARTWLYRPAMREGAAVPYRKVVGIAIGK